MSNGDKPVAGCHLCGHGGPVQFSETCICDCHKPQPAVTEGPKCDHNFVSDHGLQPACTKCGKVKDLAPCPFCREIPDFESDVQEVGSQYAVECPGCNAQGPISEYPDTACDVWDAQGASSKQAEVDKLKAENEALVKALEGYRSIIEHHVRAWVLRGESGPAVETFNRMVGDMDAVLQVSAHRDGEKMPICSMEARND